MNIKVLYRLIILSSCVILPLSLSNAYADDSKKKPVECLFVITAKEGEIKKNDQEIT